jgi:UDP-glucose 4-epimerase
MKVALVTGGSGFLGFNAAQKLKVGGFEVHGIGHGSPEMRTVVQSPFDSWTNDSVSIESLCDLGLKPDVIIHAGGGAAVGRSYADPREDFLRTVGSTSCVLDFIRVYSPDSFLIYPSSVAVHGQQPAEPIKTFSALNPVAPYGYHKFIAEELCRMYAKNFGVKHSIVRFFSIYGEGLKKQLLWDACMKFKSEARTVEFWGSGNEVRDWIHVDDAADLILNLAKTINPPELLNGGSGVGHSVQNVLQLLSGFMGSSQSIVFNGKARVGDPIYYVADIASTLELGWYPKVKLEAGLERFASWFNSGSFK